MTPPPETVGDWIGFALALFWSGAALCCFLAAVFHDPRDNPDYEELNR